MRCTNCGAELEEHLIFCPYCGVRQSTSVKNSFEKNDPYVDSDYSDPYDDTETAFSVEHERKALKFLLTSIAAVLVVAIVAGLCTNWFGFYGPATRIALAAKNTFKKGNLTVEISDDNDNNAICQIDLDVKKRTFTYLYQYEDDTRYGEKFTYYHAIYDGYVIRGRISDDGKAELYKYDCKDALEDFFDEYEEVKDWDWDDLYEFINDQSNGELDAFLDKDELEKSCKQYFRKLNSNQWLRENAGYSKTREDSITYFNFKPQPYAFLRSSLECFEDAFEDDDDYDNAIDTLKNNRSYLNRTDFEVSVGIKGNKLREISIDAEDDSKITIKFDYIGRTFIDNNVLEDLLDKAVEDE